jgi:oxalate decarboxylase/phosphoglucose isomerase-like protein (cupin superfamily)
MRLVPEREFPISTTMTGALMRIKPGALRELHWHPNADEWQYYLAGRGRMSVFGSNGRVSAIRRSRSVLAAFSTAAFAAFSQESVLVPTSSTIL